MSIHNPPLKLPHRPCLWGRSYISTTTNEKAAESFRSAVLFLFGLYYIN